MCKCEVKCFTWYKSTTPVDARLIDLLEKSNRILKSFVDSHIHLLVIIQFYWTF